MKELKCPKCGNVFTVDEADYACILQQVKTVEFDAEVTRRLGEIRKGDEVQRELALAKQKAEQDAALDRRDREIAALKAALANKDNEAKATLLEQEMNGQRVLSAKETEIAKLKADYEGQLKAAMDQVAFYKDMKARMDFFKKLDEDRRKKNCEFAVLVSLLEPESGKYENEKLRKCENEKRRWRGQSLSGSSSGRRSTASRA